MAIFNVCDLRQDDMKICMWASLVISFAYSICRFRFSSLHGWTQCLRREICNIIADFVSYSHILVFGIWSENRLSENHTTLIEEDNKMPSL